MANSTQPTIVVAGATGFVGQALPRQLAAGYKLIGLSRSIREPSPGYVQMRTADLFSLQATRKAIKGADYAIYLVHSMMPSARLVQGHFSDLDLMCADNFARAAAEEGIKRIIYVGGLLPSGPNRNLSDHLQSRLEVEHALARFGTPVTTLRAGLVVGAEGSSYQLVARLVRRLPIMVLPSWTRSRMQPIGLDDLCQAIAIALRSPETGNRTYDVASGEVLNYQQLMQATAQSIGLKRTFIGVPLLSPKLSRLWITLTTGAPKALVAPLVESLRHDMLARSDAQWQLPDFKPVSIWTHLAKAAASPSVRQPKAFRKAVPPTYGDRVHSIQRMHTARPLPAAEVAMGYLAWLPKLFMGFLKVTFNPEDKAYDLRLRGLPATLLRLQPDPSRNGPNRFVLRIVGGLLAQKPNQGQLEFRTTSKNQILLVAIHDFVPRLPWWLYRLTQAKVHLWVMHSFRRHLAAKPTALILRTLP